MISTELKERGDDDFPYSNALKVESRLVGKESIYFAKLENKDRKQTHYTGGAKKPNEKQYRKEFTSGMNREGAGNIQTAGIGVEEKKVMDMETKDTRHDLRDVADCHTNILSAHKERYKLDQIGICIYDKSDGDQLKGGNNELNLMVIEKKINHEDPMNLGTIKGELMNFPKWKRFPPIARSIDSDALSVTGKQKLQVVQVVDGGNAS